MSNIHTARTIKRCARVLLSYAKEKNILHNIQKDLLLFSKTCEKHKNFLKVLVSPVIGYKKKCKIMRMLLGENVSKIAFCFVESIIKQHKAHALLEIIKSFLMQYEELEGIKKARLHTACPLSSDEIASFKTLVQCITPCKEKKIMLMHHIDASLIGGYVLEIDNKKLDKSLKNNLNLLKKYILT